MIELLEILLCYVIDQLHCWSITFVSHSPFFSQIVVNSLVHAVPAIVNVMLVCLIFWLIFSIVGYQLFSGKFYRCVNNETLEKYHHTVVKNKSMCLESLGMRWMNAKINFDSSLDGFLALFQVVRIICCQFSFKSLLSKFSCRSHAKLNHSGRHEVV